MPTEEDTKIKFTSEEIGENNVKSETYKPQKPFLRPRFDDGKYAVKPKPKIEQQSQQREQELSIWSKIIKALPLPLIGYLTALIAPKKIEDKNNPDKHIKNISSEFEVGSVEEANNKKDHSRTK